jgi:predicted nucleic acid-binding protein
LLTLIDTSVAVALREGEATILKRAEVLQSPALLSILSVVEVERGSDRA